MLFRTNRKVVSENEYNYHNYRKYWKKMVVLIVSLLGQHQVSLLL